MKNSPTPQGVVNAIAAAEADQVLRNLIRLALSDPDAYEKLSRVFTSARARKRGSHRQMSVIEGGAVSSCRQASSH